MDIERYKKLTIPKIELGKQTMAVRDVVKQEQHSKQDSYEGLLLYAIAKIAIITARIILHLISYPQFTYDLFHMHHSPSYLSREHMNPKLTCSQRQWLHSSVGRASHRYREVTGSSPVEVLNFFQASLRNCKNCDHNCEDHSSFEYLLR